MIQQMKIHLMDSYSAFLRQLIKQNTLASEQRADELVDSFLHPTAEINQRGLQEITDLIKASPVGNVAKKTKGLLALHRMVTEQDLQNNAIIYCLEGKQDEIPKLFSKDELPPYAIVMLRGIFSTALEKCDSNSFVLHNTSNIPDAWWNYQPTRVIHIPPASGITDSSFIEASAEERRGKAFHAYRQNGGIFITNEALAVLAERTITNYVDALLQERFPSEKYGPEFAHSLTREFITTNRNITPADQHPALTALERIMEPDYDACRAGLTAVTSALSRKTAETKLGNTRHAQAKLMRDITTLDALHAILHDPSSIQALCNHSRTNDAPIGVDPHLQNLAEKVPDVLSIIKADIRILATDHKSVTVLQKELDREQRRGAIVSAAEPPNTLVNNLIRLWCGRPRSI